MSHTLFDHNRAAWNEALSYHQKARGDFLRAGFAQPGFSVFDRDCDGILLQKLSEIDFAGKSIAQLPCNNGRELLSVQQLGAKEAFGFDISDAAIVQAQQLAEISDLNATFERLNILELDHRFDARFDFIYISEGSLQWFPDLDDYFAIVSRLLKPGGQLLIFEIHPIAYLFDDANETTAYFNKGPYTYETGLDYVGGEEYEATECHWFLHKISDIVNAVLRCGIAIRSFDEYNLEMANSESAKEMEKFPLSYLLMGEKI